MIFKTFDNNDGIASKIGILNRSFSEITKAYEKAKEVTSKDNGQSFLKNFVDNLKIDVNEVSDLYKKLIVTQKDIEPFLKSIDVYDGFDDNQAKIVLNDLKTQKDLVDDNKSSWDKYYETLKNKPGMEWQEKFVQTMDLTKASTDDVKEAQTAARQAAVNYNNDLGKLTIGAKATSIALKGLALAGNILVSLVISKVISTVYEMAQASDTVGKAAKEAADELITQRQNGVQFRIGKYNILAFHSTRISLHKIVELWNQIISKVGFSDISPTVIISHIRRRGEIGGSAKKVGKRIKELERLYGIQNGATSFQGNQYEVVTNKSEAPKKSQSDLAAQMGISVDTLQNYKMLAEMIPELEELVSTGIVTTHIKRGVPKRYPLQNLDIYMPKPYNQVRSNQGYVVCLMVALTETYVFPMWNKLVTRLSPICGRE